MTQQATADRLGPFLATSTVLHVGLFALVVFGPALLPKRSSDPWGTSSVKNGISVEATANLPGIPLPSPRVVRDGVKPTDTNTLHPAPVVKTPAKAPPKPADVKIPERGATKAPQPETSPGRSSKTDIPPATGPEIPGRGEGQIALPYGQQGTGPATFGGDGTFGKRFPQYVTAMNRAIQLRWNDVIMSIPPGASRRVYVTFQIDRSGRVSELKIDERSGSDQLDNSAKRAVQTAQLPALPSDYRGNSVDVRFYYDYTR